jgi:hypothetical protein
MEAAGRRAALQHPPTADSGRGNGWRTVGGMWTDHVRSYSTPTLALGPRLRRVLAEGVDFTAKFGAQSNQALVYIAIDTSLDHNKSICGSECAVNRSYIIPWCTQL